MYKVDHRANCDGTSFHDVVIVASYKELVGLFGEPDPGASDMYKTSSHWTFVKEETGSVFTLYDWKKTNMYDDSYITVEEFRNLPLSTWHIGSMGDGELKFREWVIKMLPIRVGK